MKKLAIALNMLSPYWHDPLRRLSAKGWDLKVFVATWNEPDRQYQHLPDIGFQVQRSKNFMLRLKGLGLRTTYMHIQWGLWNDLREFSPDIILTNELGPRTAIAMLYGRCFCVPVVPWVCVSKHTERHNSVIRETLRKRMLQRAPSICTNLTEAREYLVGQLQIPQDKVFLTPYVVDVRKFNSRVVSQKAMRVQLSQGFGLSGRVLLYVGQMIERKGLRQFVSALDVFVCERERFSLLLVGGTLNEDVKAILDGWGLTYVNMPFVQPDNLYVYYAMADAFVFPTLEDEWGIVLNEAASAGLPLLASCYAGATADLVRDEFNGKVFDPFDKGSIQRAVRRVLDLSDDGLRAWGANSLSLVRQVDIDFTVDNLHAALHHALLARTHR